MFYDRFKQLADKRGLSIHRAATEIGLSNSTATKWKKTGATPDGATLQKIADYFGVSVDYLLTGGRNEKTPTQAEDEDTISVDERVEQLLSGFSDSRGATLMLDGELASPEAMESLRGALRQAVETARAVNRARRKE